VILEVDAKKAVEDGITIQRAGKTVFLVEEVPACYLKRAQATEEVKE
jgi:RNA:NAD 2'-phosphotransferase (TPT1/KptA family)